VNVLSSRVMKKPCFFITISGDKRDRHYVPVVLGLLVAIVKTIIGTGTANLSPVKS